LERFHVGTLESRSLFVTYHASRITHHVSRITFHSLLMTRTSLLKGLTVMLNVLLVEDNLRLQDALAAGFVATGKVSIAGTCVSGEDALKFCLDGHPVDAVLMDVALAGEMNGIEAAVAIRREFPRMPVVFYTRPT
jgi:hypothetical protein